jgi:hypothetical protein
MTRLTCLANESCWVNTTQMTRFFFLEFEHREREREPHGARRLEWGITVRVESWSSWRDRRVTPTRWSEEMSEKLGLFIYTRMMCISLSLKKKTNQVKFSTFIDRNPFK